MQSNVFIHFKAGIFHVSGTRWCVDADIEWGRLSLQLHGVICFIPGNTVLQPSITYFYVHGINMYIHYMCRLNISVQAQTCLYMVHVCTILPNPVQVVRIPDVAHSSSYGTLRYYDIIDFYDIIVNYFDIIVYHMYYHMNDIIDMILHMIYDLISMIS